MNSRSSISPEMYESPMKEERLWTLPALAQGEKTFRTKIIQQIIPEFKHRSYETTIKFIVVPI